MPVPVPLNEAQKAEDDTYLETINFLLEQPSETYEQLQNSFIFSSAVTNNSPSTTTHLTEFPIRGNLLKSYIR